MISMKLVLAMIAVESGGHDKAYNIESQARGCLQIRPIMVDDVNRIQRERPNLTIAQKIKTHVYTNADCYDRTKSLEMLKIYFDHYLVMHKFASDEVIVRMWKGGPYGYNRASTRHHWQKVKRYLQTHES